MRTTSTKGFSLIELLTVIAIIAILATIIIASMSKSRAGARNARRTADIGQLQIALEAYFNLNNSYPPEPAIMKCPGNAAYYNDFVGLTSALVPQYTPTLPVDPLTRDCVDGYTYVTTADSKNYTILVKMDTATDWCVGATTGSDQYGYSSTYPKCW